MDAKYWQSIESGLPIAWSNTPDPNNSAPIVQYFFSSVIYQLPLPSSYFTVPVACETAMECAETTSAMTSTSKYTEDIIDNPTDVDSISMSYSILSAICISMVLLGASSTCLIQYLCISRKASLNERRDDLMDYKLLTEPV